MIPHRLVLLVAAGLMVIAASMAAYLHWQNVRVAQARQDRKTAEAINHAAAEAIATIGNRADGERSIDEATAVAVREIKNAPDSATVHRAVRDALCVYPEFRKDPACVVRGVDP